MWWKLSCSKFDTQIAVLQYFPSKIQKSFLVLEEYSIESNRFQALDCGSRGKLWPRPDLDTRVEKSKVSSEVVSGLDSLLYTTGSLESLYSKSVPLNRLLGSKH